MGTMGDHVQCMKDLKTKKIKGTVLFLPNQASSGLGPES